LISKLIFFQNKIAGNFEIQNTNEKRDSLRNIVIKNYGKPCFCPIYEVNTSRKWSWHSNQALPR